MASMGAGVYKTMGKWLETLRRASVASQWDIQAFPSPYGAVEVWGKCGGNIKTRCQKKKPPWAGAVWVLCYFLAVFQDFNPFVDGGTAHVEFFGKV